jgi:hypothetical protein
MNRLITTLATTSAILFSLATNASAAAINLSCDSYSDNDALLWARYIDTGERKTFDVTVKLPDENAGLMEQTRPVFVGAEKIGSIITSSKAGGIAKGGLSLNRNAAYSNPGDLPPNWPGAGVGTQIRVGNLSCELKG